MFFLDDYYSVNENVICLYSLSDNKSVCDLEEELFTNTGKSPFVVNYRLLSKDDKTTLDCKRENNICMLSFPKIGTLYNFFNVKSNNFLNIFKTQKNLNNYLKKWIYQLVGSIYDIHIKKGLYHGFISEACIFVDAKLNLQIGFMGIYINESQDYYKRNYLDYCDKERINELKKEPGSLVDQFNSEKNKINAFENFRNNDIFALGKLIGKIINTYESKNKDDNEFQRRINDDIIQLCLKPSNERPTIDKIKSILDPIYKLNESNTTVDIDEILHDVNLSSLKKKRFSMPELIAEKFEEKPKLMLKLHTVENPKNIRFGLHDNYKFSVLYDEEEDSFITTPILVKEEANFNIISANFKDQLEKKFQNYQSCHYFFKNLYFCSLRDLLKFHKPSFPEIHYWMIYFTNYLQALHSGDFLEEEKEFFEPIESWDAHLPLNFSSETVFVSFLNYENHKKFDVFKNNFLQFQLNVFPFTTKKTKLSQIYKSDLDEFSNKRDIYSFGILLLEVLHSAIFGQNCFNDNVIESKIVNDELDKDEDYQIVKNILDKDDESKIVKNILDKVITKLPEDQKFYKSILFGCISGKFTNVFEIQSVIFLEGLDEARDDEFSLENIPSDNLNCYVNNHMIMNSKRFIEIFKCINFTNENIKKLFKETLNDLNQNFFKEDFDFDQEFNYLNFIDFLDQINEKE